MRLVPFYAVAGQECPRGHVDPFRILGERDS
jgi:hypothetical protein